MCPSYEQKLGKLLNLIYENWGNNKLFREKITMQIADWILGSGGNEMTN